MDNYSDYNKRNIFEFFTPKRALFLSIDALDFKDGPRLKVRCCNYDDEKKDGARITSEVASYIPIGEFLVFAHDVLSGVMARKKKLAASQGVANKHMTYFEHFGGTKWPEPISTKLALVNGLGNEAEFAFLATSTWGKVTQTGGIIPTGADETRANNGFVPQSVFINMPNNKLKEFCIVGKAYSEQFINLDLQARLCIVRKQRQAYSDKKEAEFLCQNGNSGGKANG